MNLRPAVLLRVLVLLGLALPLLPGCSGKGAKATTRPATVSERSDRALKDPFKYSLDWNDTDIAGDNDKMGRKGLGRDLGHVIMP